MKTIKKNRKFIMIQNIREKDMTMDRHEAISGK